MQTIVTNDEAETRRVAAELATRLRPGDVVALDGDLGAGKTCFVRGLAEGLGIEGRVVSSPTFVICQEYGSDRPVPLIHIDAYRVADVDELETIGFDEILKRGDTIVAIEWASRISAALPPASVRVRLEHEGPQRRRILIGAEVPSDDAGDTSCTICGRSTSRESESFPFCSKRCRSVDLGRWLGGGYRITRPAEATDWEE
jgi:tRNA threonylcarbamoyladenosine biosynthesis protein TsaE